MSPEEKSLENALGELENTANPPVVAATGTKKKDKAGLPDNIEFILDIPLRVSVELGRTKMLVNDLLQLGQGSVIELQKLAGEPMEVYVNDKLIARGEVVVVNEKFGVRLTDIISPQERIEQLK
jgi:flagellar motor switch protein FliN/FliY